MLPTCHVLTPLPPKKAIPKRGEGSNRKGHWKIILSPKMMSLQGVRNPIEYIGMCYANTPRLGVCGSHGCALPNNPLQSDFGCIFSSHPFSLYLTPLCRTPCPEKEASWSCPKERRREGQGRPPVHCAGNNPGLCVYPSKITPTTTTSSPPGAIVLPKFGGGGSRWGEAIGQGFV